MTEGRFISIEGGEGAGKSTQIALLAEKLKALGLSVDLTREPGGTEGAEAIRQLLLGGGDERWGASAEAMLFAAARSDHVEKRIKPAVAQGIWVISDRFLDSSRAYQGASLGLSDAVIMDLHRIGSGVICRIGRLYSIYRWKLRAFGHRPAMVTVRTVSEGATMPFTSVFAMLFIK